MFKITYQNKYGYLRLETTEFKDISKIHSKDIPQEFFFSHIVAEKISLITENESIQMSWNSSKLDEMYVVYHLKSDLVSVCKVAQLDFNHKYLELPNSYIFVQED